MIPIWWTVLITVAAIVLGVGAGLWIALATAIWILAEPRDDDPDERADDDPDPEPVDEPADDSPSFDEQQWNETAARLGTPVHDHFPPARVMGEYPGSAELSRRAEYRGYES